MNINLATSSYNTNFKKPLKAASFEGWIPEPKNTEKINQIIDLIKSPEIKKIAILGHASPDDDAVSSSLALNEMIKGIGKTSDVILEEMNQSKYNHLKGFNEVKFITKNSLPFINQKRFGNYDLVITVDTSNITLLPKGLTKSILKNAKHTVKIDHHPIYKSSDDFADINLVDTDISSAAQLIMQFAKPLNINVTKEQTDIFMTGILGDTSNFKFVKNPILDKKDRQLLINKGSDPVYLYKKITDYELPKSVLNLSDKLEQQVKHTEDKQISYLLINDKDTEVINQNKNIQLNLSKIKNKVFKSMNENNNPTVKMIVSSSPNLTSFQIRSDKIDLTNVYKKFNIYEDISSGGHPRAGYIRLPNSLSEQNLNLVINSINQEIHKQTNV